MNFYYASDAVTRQAQRTGLRLTLSQTIAAARRLQNGKRTCVLVTVTGVNRKTNQYQY